jgi:4-amino-4-deoxy-L-arabinose transferase-like glycosyltransferase
MQTQKIRKAVFDSLPYIAYLILFLGIALRLCIYFQNRCLFLDEANLARNIYERTFSALILPLDYGQYAPPVFLWLVKLLTTLFGFREYTLKFISLFSGISSLILFYLLLRRFQVRAMLWYPLFLMATGYIYLRYATELKQYSSDTFIALSLLYLAVYIDYRKMHPQHFLFLWACVGSLVIWSAMPSVFILAGVGVYYFILLCRSKDIQKVYVLSLIVLIWMAQFGFYYFAILKPQIQSDYLQMSHRMNFLFLIPKNRVEFVHNWDMTSNVLGVAAGHWLLSQIFHIILIIIALFYAIRNKIWDVFLLVIPMALILFSAALHQFTLEPRVVLFIMPFLLLLIGIGFEQVMRYKSLRWIFFAASLICAFNFNQLELFYKPLQTEQVTDSMKFLQSQKIEGSHLYVHGPACAVYIYYTSMHPDSVQWMDLKGAHILPYIIDYDSLAQAMTGQSALLYAYESPNTIAQQQSDINRHITTVAHYAAHGSETFIYRAAQ